VDEALSSARDPRHGARILAIADELPASCLPKEVRRSCRQIRAQAALSVICECLALPQADRPKFIAWTNSFKRLHRRLLASWGYSCHGVDEALSGKRA